VIYLQPCFQNLPFFGQEQIGVRLIHPHRAAEHDEQIGKRRIERPKVMHAEIVIVNPVISGRKHGLESPEILEMNVPEVAGLPRGP